jgi:cytochrome P450
MAASPAAVAEQMLRWARSQAPSRLALLALAALLALRVASFLGRGAARWVRVAAGTRGVPAAPGSHWLLGHVFQLASGCAWEQMYDWVGACGGPLVRFRILHRTGVVVGDPRGLKRVFQTRYKAYDKDLDFSYRPFLPILGSGLVTANGDAWQAQRLLVAPALRVDMLDAILPIARRATDRLASKLEGVRGTGQVVDVEEELRLLTLQVIGEAILSLPPAECDRVFPQLYLPVMEESNARVLQPWRHLYPRTALRYASNVRQLNAYLVGIIRRRRAERAAGRLPGEGEGARPGDILDRILQSVEERGGAWGAAAETQLCYEMKTFLLAGHETSAAMLTWTLYELTQAPQALAAVRAEAVAAFGAGGGGAPPARGKVDAMLWTLACLKESLRKYSVVPVVTRNLNADDELCGHRLPAGSWIICHLQRVHHLYKDPLRWSPARFMPGGEYDAFDDDVRPYMFAPFIQGPRNCLGQYFALLEARVVLADLCARFTFTPVDAVRQGKTHPTVIPVGPLNGMRMTVT